MTNKLINIQGELVIVKSILEEKFAHSSKDKGIINSTTHLINMAYQSL